jgi:hypothetical protein
MKEHTLKELADIGAKASRYANGSKLYGSLTVDPNKSAYISDAPFREAFAKAVRDAVLANVDALLDPYADLKAAHAAGKVIQFNVGSEIEDDWRDGFDLGFNCELEYYRIKPEPEPVLVPLDINDIRATDEFRHKDSDTRHVLTCWSSDRLRFGMEC